MSASRYVYGIAGISARGARHVFSQEEGGVCDERRRRENRESMAARIFIRRRGPERAAWRGKIIVGMTCRPRVNTCVLCCRAAVGASSQHARMCMPWRRHKSRKSTKMSLYLAAAPYL